MIDHVDALADEIDVFHAAIERGAPDARVPSCPDFALRDLVHGGEIAIRGDREAGFDDVDTHVVEQLGDRELFLMSHGRAGALLTVAQRRVEDNDAVLLGWGRGGHVCGPSRRMRRAKYLSGRSWVSAVSVIPRVPRRIAQPALRGG